MGEVLLGMRHADSFRRLVAIKRLRAEHRNDASFRRMFLEEARIAGLIRHPNVVSVLDVGDDDEGPFLVMDFIESVTVNAMLKSLTQDGDTLPVQIAARITKQVASGLAAAHELRTSDGKAVGLIHRDISPQNILLGFDGVARLTDFGIAKASTSNGQTTTGLLKGKVGYMSPEQLKFERPTQRSDLFSLGVVLFELLSGQRLYGGRDTVAVAQKILSEPTPDIFAIRDDVPPAMIELTFELLAKEAADRPESARDVAKRLEMIVDDLSHEEGALRLEEFLLSQFHDDWDSIRTRSETMVQTWEKSVRRKQSRMRRGWAAAAVVLLASVGGVAALTMGDDPAPEPTESSQPSEVVQVETPIVVETEPQVAEETTTSATDSAPSAPEGEETTEPPPREARPQRPRMRGTMRGMRGFNALELIRGGR